MNAALSPLRFLARAAEVHPQKIAIIDGSQRISYRQFAASATRLARGLQESGIEPGDRVAYLSPNTSELLIAHFAVPLAGAALVAINTRLAPAEVAYICAHSGAKLLLADSELLSATDLVETEVFEIGSLRFDELLARGSDEPMPWEPPDEDATITINYTSGTTGKPKGVIYTHRGAYLNAFGETFHSRITAESIYLWTLPMFHCNGWCATWAVTAAAATHVCLRAVRPDEIWRLLQEEHVTHLSGAPTVLTTISTADQAAPLEQSLIATTAGAPPSPATIAQFEALNATVVHVYGLTETYGPYSVCEEQLDWKTLDSDRRAALLARQGVGMLQADRLRVVDDEMFDVPADGTTIGEIVMRGNNVMKGYFADADATALAFRGGWFHSGDLGVMHPDGYAQLVDRAKDIIISGGENISTVEVEHALLGHEAVLDVAVIGVPDEKWGERPKAYVVLKQDAHATEAVLIDHVKTRIARYKAPREIEFLEQLPRTSTGKVQKYTLREREWAGHGARIKG